MSQTQKTLTAALVGFGSKGKMLFKLLNDLPNISLRYVLTAHPNDLIDTDKALVDTVDNCELLRTDELDSILLDKTVDAVIIATTANIHMDLIRIACKHEKAIYCDKSLSMDPAVLKQLNNELIAKNTPCQVALTHRFDPDLVSVRKRLHEGDIGTPQVIKLTNRMTNSAMDNNGYAIPPLSRHDFDMIHFLTNQAITDVFTLNDTRLDSSYHQQLKLDSAMLSLKLADGTLVVIDTKNEANYEYDQRIEIFADSGMLRADNLSEGKLEMVNRLGKTHALPYWQFVERYRSAYRQSLIAFRDFVLEKQTASPAAINELITATEVQVMVQKAIKQTSYV